MVIALAKDGDHASRVAEAVMRALPQWFGLEEPLRAYVEAARVLPTLVATVDGVDVGFLTIKEQTPEAAEILAMGVLPHCHRRGLGRGLVEEACRLTVSQDRHLLQVKTFGPTHPSPNYTRTRVFYEALGFVPL